MKMNATPGDFREPRLNYLIKTISFSAGTERSCRFEKSAKKVLGRCPNKPHRGDFVPTDALLATICLILKGRNKKCVARGSYLNYNEG